LKTIKKLYLALMLIFLYAPIIVLMVFSFNKSKIRGAFTGFTFDWYRQLFNDSMLVEAFIVTMIVAVVSSIIATVIGTAAALGINAMKSKTRKVVLALTNIPVMIPDIVMGISLMILFVFIFNFLRGVFGIDLDFGYTTLIIAHITFNIPFVILSVLPKIRQLDKNIYEAAMDLGATPMYAFRKIIMPLIFPGIMTGAIFAFTLSLDDFIVSYFTKGIGTQTLSVYIYTLAAKRELSPKLNALSTIMFGIVLLLLVIINIRDSRELRQIKKQKRALAAGRM